VRDDGQFVDTTLDRLAVEDVVAGLPVREFRSYHGRLHYSGWYWSSSMSRLLARGPVMSGAFEVAAA
jgi:hypothetical protein